MLYGIKLPSMTMGSNLRVQLNGFVYFLVKTRGLIGGINIETINAPNPWTMVFGGTKYGSSIPVYITENSWRLSKSLAVAYRY